MLSAPKPQVLLFSHELEAIQASGSSSGAGVAYLLDAWDGIPEVVHLSPLGRSSGSSEREVLQLDWYVNQGSDGGDANGQSASGATLWIDTNSSPVQARCTLRVDGGQTLDCTAEIVQTGARAFTRNASIVETDALAGTSVLCVGLGSGGSAIADMLTRSGVGRLLLWDMDRLEAHNIGRHVCTLRDLGRRKVFAVRDHLQAINPSIRIECFHRDVLTCTEPNSDLDRAVAEADCVVVGTDNNASRFALNDIAWRRGKTALYGRAFTRAAGGDVIQVIPPKTPCYACHLAGRVVDEEISSPRDASRVAYADHDVPVQPGLSVDIQPVANMIARLCVLRLCETLDSGLKAFAEELTAPLYLWANRREQQFAGWRPMERSYDRLAVLRWYGISVRRDPECATCGTHFTS